MKHPVILDACTIINLLRIDTKDGFLFNLLKLLDLNMTSIVLEEVNCNIQKNPLSEEQNEYIEDTMYKFQSLFRPRQNDEIIKDISQDYFEKLCQFTNHTKKHNGELFSSALSLCISREKNSRVYFYTDDFPAKKQFSKYFDYQQIGVIGDSVDLLLFLYWTNTSFEQGRLKKYLQDLRSEYNTPLRKLVNKIQTRKDSFSKRQKKDRVLMENINKILDGCYSNSLLMNEGISFFLDNKNYVEIKQIIKMFPDINKDCLLAKKVQDIIQALLMYKIFKVA